MKKSLILFILLVQFWSLWADGYYCKTIGLKERLSLAAVTDVTYDGKGGLWIGTRFGLNQYRNGRIQTYLDDGRGRIQGNYVNLVHLDTWGNLWTSTDKGLFLYDKSSDSFQLLSEDPVTCAVDDEDGVWFGAHFGLKHYSGRNKTLSSSDSEIYTDYQALYQYQGKLLSLDKKEGLVWGGEALPLPELGGSMIMASALHEDKLYLSLLNDGLIVYDLTLRQIVFSLKSGQQGFPYDPLLALLVMDDELWMGFDGAGILSLSLDNYQWKSIEKSPVNNGERIPLSVTKLYKDPLGNVWIGSVRSGLIGLKWSPVKSFNLTSSYPAAENVIIDVFSSTDGNIYLGTDGSGICRYSPQTGITLAPRMEGIKVTSIADFDEKNLLIATYNLGFFLVDRVTGARRPFTLADRDTNAAECFNSNAPTIYNLENGNILLLAVHPYEYNPRTRIFLPFLDETEGLATELIPIGPGNGTFYAYSSAGLFTLDLSEHRISRIYEPDLKTGSINTAVFHGGHIWFGTNYGLFTFDPRNSTVLKLDSGLFSRVSRLQSNGTDNLWIAADNTLFLRRNSVVEMTGENRGVPANEILSSTCTPDGTIYLGGTAGVVEIGADCYFSEDRSKKVELRDASSDRLVLPHNYTSLAVSVNLAGADPFERILYRYHLLGASEMTTETFEDSISLPALKPGNYRLDVSYLRSDGTWSEAQQVSSIRVKYPWYSSMPMILIYILMGISLIFISVDRLSRRRLKTLEAELLAKNRAFTGKIDEYIDQHLGDPQLNVAQIAEHMAMSRATLYHKINSAYGKGVAEIVEERRMAKAEELLRTSSLSVLDISEKVGYSTSRYFSTRFKQVHDGVTPLKYRQANQ
jgi:AraC-like DNA-binding protein